MSKKQLTNFKKLFPNSLLEVVLQGEEVELKVIEFGDEKPLRKYSKTLSQSNLPEELKLIYGDLYKVFEGVNEESFQLDLPQKKVHFKFSIKAGEAILEKNIAIQLEESFCGLKQFERIIQTQFEQMKGMKQQTCKLTAKVQQIQESLQEKTQPHNNFCYLLILIGFFMMFGNVFSEDHVKNYETLSWEISMFEQKIEEIKNSYALLRECLRIPSNFQKGSPNINKFSFQNNEIMLVGEGSEWVQILHKDEIPRTGIYKFKIHLKELSSNKLLIGIVNRKKQLLARTSFQSGQAVVISSKSGCIWHGDEICEGNNRKLYESQVITVTVDLTHGYIQWSVNQFIRGSVSLDFLKDEERQFVPYVEMFAKGDKIEWIP